MESSSITAHRIRDVDALVHEAIAALRGQRPTQQLRAAGGVAAGQRLHHPGQRPHVVVRRVRGPQPLLVRPCSRKEHSAMMGWQQA